MTIQDISIIIAGAITGAVITEIILRRMNKKDKN